MAIEPGTRLGPYEITGPIGAGGMGEVYKAKDTRLDRTVAIKVLPEHLSKDPERRERFEREARAVSSLNHPHICTLYEFDTDDGIDFIVMEYIEGETLADRLSRGPLPLEQALEYSIQIADGLDKAHRHGVVHRDLKPGNVMLTKPGVKLLDFGLAKLQSDGAPTEGSEQPTQQKPLTDAGVILGTVQYMAPEQLEGKEADARSDMFAFGAVLYEMMTGRKAFEGKSQASLIGAILKDDPKPVSELQPTSPRTLDRILKKSLAKDPEDRYHSAHDLMDELKWIAEGSAREDATEPSEGRRGPSQRIAPLAGFLIGIVAAGAGVWYLTRPAPPSPLRLSVNLPAGQTFVTDGNSPPFIISPDGKKLVYAAQVGGVSQLYIRDLEQFESRPIRGTEGARSPFFSPDGQSVGFFTPYELKKVVLPDGTPVDVAAEIFPTSRGASWGLDDTIVYVPRIGSELMRVPAGGGTPESITTDVPDGDRYGNPHILPDGNEALITIDSGGRQHAIAVVSLDTGQVQRLGILGEAGGGQYVPTGHLVYGSSGSLLAVPFDPERPEIQHAPVSILEGVWTDAGAVAFMVSETGALVYVAGGELSRALVWVDREGQATSPLENRPAFHALRLSPDGRRVAFGSFRGIWIHDLGRGTHTRLVIGGEFPVWTPDGTRLAFSRSRAIHSVPADGSGEPEVLLPGEHEQWPMSWSPDGRFLAITEHHPQTGRDIWVIPREEEPIPFLVTAFQEGAATFSPDGRWLAYVSDESGTKKVYAQPFPGPGQKVTLSTEGGAEPVWSPAGGELFYRRGSDMMVVDVTTEPTFRAGTPRLLFSGDYLTDAEGHPSYDVSSDGQRFLMQDVQAEGLTEIRVILNWTEELKRLAPTEN